MTNILNQCSESQTNMPSDTWPIRKQFHTWDPQCSRSPGLNSGNTQRTMQCWGLNPGLQSLNA